MKQGSVAGFKGGGQDQAPWNDTASKHLKREKKYSMEHVWIPLVHGTLILISYSRFQTLGL